MKRTEDELKKVVDNNSKIETNGKLKDNYHNNSKPDKIGVANCKKVNKNLKEERKTYSKLTSKLSSRQVNRHSK
jgi:hypothetical protein